MQYFDECGVSKCSEKAVWIYQFANLEVPICEVHGPNGKAPLMVPKGGARSLREGIADVGMRTLEQVNIDIANLETEMGNSAMSDNFYFTNGNRARHLDQMDALKAEKARLEKENVEGSD